MWYPSIAPLKDVLQEMSDKYHRSIDSIKSDMIFLNSKGDKEIADVSNLMNKTATVGFYLIGGTIRPVCFLKPLYKKDNVVYKGV